LQELLFVGTGELKADSFGVHEATDSVGATLDNSNSSSSSLSPPSSLKGKLLAWCCFVLLVVIVAMSSSPMDLREGGRHAASADGDFNSEELSLPPRLLVGVAGNERGDLEFLSLLVTLGLLLPALTSIRSSSYVPLIFASCRSFDCISNLTEEGTRVIRTREYTFVHAESTSSV
jgi:hypothetical protein